MSLRQWRYLQLAQHVPWLQKLKKRQSLGLSLDSVYRLFSSCQAHRTDGVYAALTEMRVKIPWIEALNRKKEATGSDGKHPSVADRAVARDLAPKRMSESYHRVVRNSYMAHQRLAH
jgi:hypothetical protein